MCKTTTTSDGIMEPVPGRGIPKHPHIPKPSFPGLNEDAIHKFFGLIDSTVECYLGGFIKPFIALHEKYYGEFNVFLRGLLDDNKANIPDWFMANFITYLRTVVVIPTLLLLAWGHTLLPALLVVLVDFGDFLDGVVARFWVDVRKERAAMPTKDKASTLSVVSDSDAQGFGTYSVYTKISDVY